MKDFFVLCSRVWILKRKTDSCTFFQLHKGHWHEWSCKIKVWTKRACRPAVVSNCSNIKTWKPAKLWGIATPPLKEPSNSPVRGKHRKHLVSDYGSHIHTDTVVWITLCWHYTGGGERERARERDHTECVDKPSWPERRLCREHNQTFFDKNVMTRLRPSSLLTLSV